MPYHSELYDKRHREAVFAWHYLRQVRQHNHDFCYNFIRDNYFISRRKLLNLLAAHEPEPPQDPATASVTFHLLMSNQYLEYYNRYSNEVKRV